MVNNYQVIDTTCSLHRKCTASAIEYEFHWSPN